MAALLVMTLVFIESLFRVFNMLKEEALSWHMVALSQQYAEKYVLFLRFFRRLAP